MKNDAQSLIAELEASLPQRSDPQRLTMLRRITDLFLDRAMSYSADHVAVFDDVMCRLIEKSDRQALIELSAKLAAVDNAPMRLMSCLSRSSDIGVSGPVLENSNVLTDADLTEIAAAKNPAHLLAIAGRSRISGAVADALLALGNSEVTRKLATNDGVTFSDVGMVKLVYAAKDDGELASVVANRTDVPPEMQPFLKLAGEPG